MPDLSAATPTEPDDDFDHPDEPQPPAAPAAVAAPQTAPVTTAEVDARHAGHTPDQVHIRPETVQAATWESLQGKHARRDLVLVPSVDAEGRAVNLEIKMKAISNTAYDKLLDAYSPSRADQAKGAIYDRERFPAALLEAVVTSPKLTFDQWMTLSTSDTWSGGEFGALFGRANMLCQGGLDVPFTGRG